MLWVYFLHHRELLGAMSMTAYETVKELMAGRNLRFKRDLEGTRRDDVGEGRPRGP